MLWVPDSFELKLLAEQVVTILNGRLRIGESLLRTTFADVKDTGIGNYRRAVRRWQAGNDVIVDSALRDTCAGSAASEVKAVAVGPQSLEQEFDEISNDLSRDITRLSMLRYQIAIEAGLPIDQALTSETPQAEAPETHCDTNVENEVPSVECSERVAAPPEAVWNVVADENRLGEWSDEWCRRGFKWMSYKKVLERRGYPDYRLQWRTGSKVSYRGLRKWELELAGNGAGTTITEKALGRHPASARLIIRADLEHLKEITESPQGSDISQTADKLALLTVYTTQFGSYTTMLWQVPALGLTAQAFLMTIALGSPISDDARIAAAALSMIIAWASQSLMHSQRGRAINQAELAKRISAKLFLKQYLGDDFALDDAVPSQTNARDVWEVDHKIYAIWKICMLIFVAVDIVVIISVVWGFKFFGPSS